MGMDWDITLLAQLQDIFGEPVNYRPAMGAAYDITGIFDRGNIERTQFIDEGPAISPHHPVLRARALAFRTQPNNGDRLFIYRLHTLFVINHVQPDIHGGSILILNEVSTL